MIFTDGGITEPKGFKAGACEANIKYTGRLDMAAIYSEAPCKYAATFTRNVVKAAPVNWDMTVLQRGGPVHAVIINSGIANAATGEEGALNCVYTAEHAAERFGINHHEVLVASTGVIGMQLPLEKVKAGVDMLWENLSEDRESADAAARAIMTTDTVKKEVCVNFEIGDTIVTIAGMAKGSGMIHPNMGTLLAFITTDADIDNKLLQEAVRLAVDETFNMVTIDGDTSTNDTCMVLANGMAGNAPIKKWDASFNLFKDALTAVLKDLSMKIAGDGEGATSLMEVVVKGAKSLESARILAKSVCSSNLTKAAVFGHDANWGRILCALGYSGEDFRPELVDIRVESEAGTILLCENGAPVEFSEEEAKSIFSQEKVTIICDMKAGGYEATAWGCDLSYDYVKINADYRS